MSALLTDDIATSASNADVVMTGNEETVKPKELTAEEKQDLIRAKLAEVQEKQLQLASDPEGQRAWLRSLSRFQQYSFKNYLLILTQNPRASKVASYKSWKEQGRQVRKGESGLAIFRPNQRMVAIKDKVTGEPILDAKGKPKKKPVMTGKFNLVKGAFDISQTDPIEGATSQDTGASEGSQALIDDLTKVMTARGIRVSDGGQGDQAASVGLLLNPNAGGFYSAAEKLIVLAPGLSLDRKARVMAHECAHQELHSNQPGYNGEEDQRVKEVEAEAAAYAICAAYGIASNEDYSLRYINNWAGNDPKRLGTLFGAVHNGVRALLRDVEATKGAAS